jgi:hypothetical protein
MRRERRMNPKYQTRPRFDNLSARSAHLTGLKMRRITRVSSFDDLVSGHEQCLRNRKSKRFGGLKIDHELVLRRLCDR